MPDFVSLADLKTALEISDTSRDVVLTLANRDATAMIIDWLNRDPRAADYDERVDGRGSTSLLVNQYPINSVTSVTFADQTSISADQLDFDDISVWLKPLAYFPRGRRNITVSYNAGLDPLPSTVARAAIYTVRAILTSAKVDLNSTGESWAGVSSQTWNPGGPGVVPVAAQNLIRSLQRKMSVS